MSKKQFGRSAFGRWLANAGISAMINALRILPFNARIALCGRLMARGLGPLVGYKKRIETNLTHIWPELARDAKDQIIDDVLDNAGRAYFENLYPHEFQNAGREMKLTGEGLEEVLEAHKEGRPVLYVSGHFGNHEALRAAIYDQGYKIGGLYKPMANPYFNKRYEKTIQLCGRSGPLFPVGREGTRGFRSALKAGSPMILLIDIAVHGAETLEFLGKPALTSTAGAAFALNAGALYVPYFSMRDTDRKNFTVEIAKPIAHSDAATMTQAANDLLSDRIMADPGNWFWVHRRWKPWVV